MAKDFKYIINLKFLEEREEGVISLSKVGTDFDFEEFEEAFNGGDSETIFKTFLVAPSTACFRWVLSMVESTKENNSDKSGLHIYRTIIWNFFVALLENGYDKEDILKVVNDFFEMEDLSKWTKK